MRTPASLPDDIYEIARSFAVAKRISLGEALALLIRRGLESSSRIQNDSAFPHFRVSKHAAPIRLKQTLDAEDER